MILMIDNYDSFVFNLARYVEELGFAVKVVRNDALSLTEIAALRPSHIILSPGPGHPAEAGICCALIKKFYKSVPILGVCLGHQAIGHVFGATITAAKEPMHGKSCQLYHQQQGIFAGLNSPTQVGRYHSLIVDGEGLDPVIEVTARSAQGELMALAHRAYPLWGVQFHPESILTNDGYALLTNFLKLDMRTTWQPDIANLSGAIDLNMQNWLSMPQRLTRELRKSYRKISIDCRGQGEVDIFADEQYLLGAIDTLFWGRHIFIRSEAGPIVFGRTVMSNEAYQHFASTLDSLHNKPIGETFLFSYPASKRSQFEFMLIDNAPPCLATLDHYLAQVDANMQIPLTRPLPARRSIFTLAGFCIVLTEVFLQALPKYEGVSPALK